MPIDRNTGLWVANGGNSGVGGGNSSGGESSSIVKQKVLWGRQNGIMKFSKGKMIYSIPNGLGKGAYFDGASYAQIANVENLPYGNTTPLTYSILMYPTNQWSGSQHVLFAFGTDYNNAYKIQFCGFNKINIGFNSWEFPCELNNWYHIVVTRDENKNWNVYYNANLLASQNWNVDIPSGGEAYIGGWYYSSFGNSDYHFYGNLANFQVFNRALTQEEVTALYNKQEITNGRVLHIPLQYGKDDESMFVLKNFVYDYSTLTTSSGFDEFGYPIRFRSASGANVAYNTYPVPADAILSNCESLMDKVVTYTNCEVSTDIKKTGKGSIKINQDGYIKFQHGVDLLANPWTVGHFFYADNYAIGGSLGQPLINNDDDQIGIFGIGISTSGALYYFIRGGAQADMTSTLSAGWHHLRVAHISGNTLRVYLDGVFIYEINNFTRSTNYFVIGKWGYLTGSHQFSGYIDNIEFFEIPSDKLANYSGETAPVPTNKF